MPAKRPIKDRFFDKIRYNPSSGCMEWTRGTNSKGYGQIQEGGQGTRNLYAHRVRYELETGLEIPKGLCICHRCDNPLCVTFAHFFLGTKADNNRDRDLKGRQRTPKGEKHGRAHVPDKVKDRVVEEYKTGAFTMKELAAEVGVSQMTISRWVNGKVRSS